MSDRLAANRSVMQVRCWLQLLLGLLAAARLEPTAANMYDVLEPTKQPPASCRHGCARWDDLEAEGVSFHGSHVRNQGDADAMWASGTPPSSATCAQPGAAMGKPLPDDPNSNVGWNGWMGRDGSWCWCKNGSTASPLINVTILDVCNASDPAQNWVVEPPSGSTGSALVRHAESGLCLSFQGVALHGHQDVGLRACGEATRWHWNRSGTAELQAASDSPGIAGAGGKCLDVDGGKGPCVDLYSCHPDASNAANQQWDVDAAAGLLRTRSPTAVGSCLSLNYSVVNATAPPFTGAGYCTAPPATPEQINIQLASEDAVVVSFVTYGEVADTDGKPVVMFGTDPAQQTRATGVTHHYSLPPGVSLGAADDDDADDEFVGMDASLARKEKRTLDAIRANDGDSNLQPGRVYQMHFVKLSGLTARARYHYTVSSGGKGAVTSELFSFAAPYSDGVTRVAIFGDMGVYTYNNMGNLYDDVTAGTVDMIVHMGDHAYNIGDGGDARGDGYMNAYQKVLTRVPWIPVVGNHESGDGDNFERYFNQTWGHVLGQMPGSAAQYRTQATNGHLTTAGAVSTARWVPPPAAQHGIRSSATSQLGALLSTGLSHGVGREGATPSGTSRWFSSDFGLVHWVALDLNVYYFSSEYAGYHDAQLAWLAKDLASVNRRKTPWIIATSHFPMYCTGCRQNGTTENTTHQNADMEPLFLKYGVDLYLAGHWHYYESLYPVRQMFATTGIPAGCATSGDGFTAGCTTQHDFHNPNSPVHITTGNAGPPSLDSWIEDCHGVGNITCHSVNATRKQSLKFGYGRIVVYNASTLLYQQVANEDGSIVDEFVVTQDSHGTFPPL